MELIREVTSSKDSLERTGMTRALGSDVALKDNSLYFVIEVDDKEFREQIVLARGVQGQTGADLARVLGVSKAYVSRIERGHAPISAQMRYKLLSYINLDTAPNKQ